MVIFGQTREPGAGSISGGKGPAVPSSLRDRELNRAKVITNLIKIKEEIRSLWKGINAFIKTVLSLCKKVAALSRPIYISISKEKKRRRKREKRKAKKEEDKKREEEEEVKEELKRKREKRKF